MSENRLLQSLPDDLCEKVMLDVVPVTLKLRQVVATRGDSLEYVLFPRSCLISVVVNFENGNTIEAELEAVSYLTDGGGALRPKVTYLITDHIKFILGADVFFGPSRSYYGQFKANSLLFTEVRYGF